MSYTIDLDLDPLIIEALEELGKSNALETNICEILTDYVKMRYYRLHKENLNIKQNQIANKVKNEKITMEKFNVELLFEPSKNEKFEDEEKKLLEIYNTLNLFKQGKLTYDDFEKHKKEFLTLKLKNKEKKKNSPVIHNHSTKQIQEMNILIKERKSSELGSHKSHSSLESKVSVDLTTENILDNLSHEWQNIKEIIFKMGLKNMMDARFLQVKLKELERNDLIEMQVTKKGKKHWRLKLQ